MIHENFEVSFKMKIDDQSNFISNVASTSLLFLRYFPSRIMWSNIFLFPRVAFNNSIQFIVILSHLIGEEQ